MRRGEVLENERSYLRGIKRGGGWISGGKDKRRSLIESTTSIHVD